MDIGGTTPGTEYDTLSILGTASLGGDLEISLLDGFLPATNDLFTVLDSETIVDQFENIPAGERLTTSDGLGSFLVSYGLGSPFEAGALVRSEFLPLITVLRAGDSDEDFDFDQLDLVKVQIAGKYLTGQPATWGDCDWDGAPGGTPGTPPTGDGLFNQFDIIAAQIAGTYLTGPYAATGDGQTSIVYDPSTGELAVDAPSGVELTSLNIDSTAGIFVGESAQNLGGSFDNDADNSISKATFGGSFGSLSFGEIVQKGLSEAFVLGDLNVAGSLSGGGSLGDVDLVYVPEPSACILAAMSVIAMPFANRRMR